jgi:uncharacterized protein (TIGR02266 family)
LPPMSGEKEKPNIRVHPRVDLFTKVKIIDKDSQQTQELLAGNVSQGGIFLRSNRPLPEGKKVSLQFELEQGPVQIDEAEVVWSKPFEAISVDGSLPGMGLRFSQAREEAISRIGHFINEALSEDKEQLPLEKQSTDPEINSNSFPSATPPSEPPAPAAIQQTEGYGALADVPQPARLKVELTSTKPAFSEPVPSELKISREEIAPPPPAGKRLALFLLFVLAAAAITFLVLWLTHPLDRKQSPSATPVEPPPSTPEPVTDRPPEAPASQEPARDAPSAGAPSEPQMAQQKAAAPAALPAQLEKPAVPPAQIEKPPKPPVQAEKPVTPASEKPGTAPEPAMEKPAAPAPAPQAQASPAAPGGQLSAPVFRQTDRGWQMELLYSQAKKVDHFPLKNPPRLAIDLYGLIYAGKQKTIEAPAPMVQRLRLGVDADKTRLVLDFSGEKVPPYKVVKTSSGLVVNFY